MKKLVHLLLGSMLVSVQVENAIAQALWYKQPAQKWTEALPLGNGRIGAMVFGGIETDRIQFNEESLWTGAPRNPNRADAWQALPEIRGLLAAGKQAEAEALAERRFMGLKSPAGDRAAWVAKMTAGNTEAGSPAQPAFNDASWSTMQVPSYEGWEQTGLANFDGVVWFRTTFDLPENWKGKNLVLDLNRIRDQDFTYVNGTLVGRTDSHDPRRYRIPAALLKPGRNTLAVQVLNYADKGGIAGYKDPRRPIGLFPEGADVSTGLSLVKTWRYWVQNAEPPASESYQASYQPFGDVWLRFKNQPGPVSGYRRSLDLKEAVLTTAYRAGGIAFRREYFVSQPDQAMVIHLGSDKRSAISLDIGLSSPHLKSAVRQIGQNALELKVQVSHGALHGTAQLRAVLKGGKIRVSDSALHISEADDVVICVYAATNFISSGDVSASPDERVQTVQKKLQELSYPALKERHIKAYTNYFDKFFIDFGGQERNKLPTDERIRRFAADRDPALVALLVQYGRYLLISSSWPGTQPANLQGIWNDQLSPPWGSKYTTNINLEMNYWPAEVLNLAAMNEPLFVKVAALAAAGRQTAINYYRAGGWVLHHNTDIWNATAPINAANHGIWVTGAAWLSTHLWEHYLFSRDEVFLRNQAYPVMRGAAVFFKDFLVVDPKTGKLISTPSNSPEQGGLVAGPTMDHQIIRTLFRQCAEASRILKTDAALRDSLLIMAGEIAPNQIGRFGQLQEWLEDIDDTTNKHRHVSHLWGVHPGDDITWNKNPELMKAARQSLIYRGDEGTGWSLAWKINFWARFKDGNHAMKMISMLLRPAGSQGGVYPNLFDAHPPFQIDGNFGAAAGVTEMLVQSHDGLIDILPALPDDLPFGQVRGLRARGAVEIDLDWQNGKLRQLRLKPTCDGPLRLRYGNLEKNIDAKKGRLYTLNGLFE
ncbi:glycoside hydrolase N-terminal domain-containing protein [Pedobacter sp. SYP-B3415]|uniref:glycoside hydrolase family 95 protein n=1 Tax=Pedobacter sp. SYP-B3415 TaxID=2496641 RepID=UPI00101C304B|nr:glycoside hydrolase N-terminal domain-containing protein [Pedobacter sp. SYP-B3415]